MESTPIIDAWTGPFLEITSTGLYTGIVGGTFLLDARSKVDYNIQSFVLFILFRGTTAAASLRKDFYRDASDRTSPVIPLLLHI